MFVYRIAKSGYVHDLSGNGSRIFGGRWSPPGIPVIYTSQSRSLAALEFYVHTSQLIIPSNLMIAEILIPDKTGIKQISLSGLPGDWNIYPAPLNLQEYGLNWVNSGESLVLQVPSVQVNHEFNFIINPSHPDMKNVKIGIIEEFIYDGRLTKR